MSYYFARIHLLQVDAASEEERLSTQIILDLKIDQQTGLWCGPYPALGFWGSTKSDIFPFVLERGEPWAVINWGNNADLHFRREEININMRPIARGELFTFKNAEGKQDVYRVREITKFV